ncbi:hypothetical protein C8T65DRAFT_225860 [Cerioporus squamosus]|nr:hypothetical protein C8T65DRAFT_225860 [Cerioporus squamosus]
MSEVSRKRSPYHADDGCIFCSTPQHTTKTRDADYWFDDGNIILVAEDVEFRVYAAPLMRCSPVFREMLSLLQPPGDHAVYSSIPIVPLFDHPTDIRCLLGSIIFGNDLRFSKTNPDFKTLSSLIRMGHKYQIDCGVEAGMHHLQSYYPARFADWEAVRAGPPHFSQLDHIGVVNLARLTDTPSVLPLAFLHCCTLDPRTLIKGLRREDDTWETLSPEDLATVLAVRAELIVADALDCMRILDEDCVDPEGCRQTLAAILLEHIGLQDWQRCFGAGWRQPLQTCLQRVGMVPCDVFADAIEQA